MQVHILVCGRLALVHIPVPNNFKITILHYAFICSSTACQCDLSFGVIDNYVIMDRVTIWFFKGDNPYLGVDKQYLEVIEFCPLWNAINNVHFW